MPRVGDVIAERFVLERRVGAGGMGVVYRAFDRQTGQPVALKVMLGDSSEAVERFATEAEALAALDDPGIVRLITHGAADDEQPFLAMEWLEGEDLEHRLRRGALRVEDAVVLGLRVAEALSVAHARGFVHRDIKPSNLFLVEGDITRVKVLDFGIARLGADLARRLTASGVIMGTPGYMAPEQVRGAMEVDARADVFSLGAVLFECFAGRPAFSGEHPMAVLAKLLLEEAPRLDVLRADLPIDLTDLIARMLSKSPRARPASAAAVASELSELMSRFEGGWSDPSEDGSIARAPRSEGAPSAPRSMTRGERRLISVVVARVPSKKSVEQDEATSSVAPFVIEGARTIASGLGSSVLGRLRTELSPLGVKLDSLLDGSILAVISGAGSATDQAACAARCALAVRRIAPDASVALVTGLGDVSGALPVGDVLDRAAALLASSAASTVRIDPVSAGLLDVRFEVGKGRSGLELFGEHEVGAEARRLLGRPSPCVGRDRELRALSDVLDECIRESVAMPVLITGPAGMGKSRVRHEMVREAKQRAPELEVWIARCDPISAGSPLGVVASAIRTTAGVIAGEPPELRWEKLSARVARRVPERDVPRVTEMLGEMIGAPPRPGEGSALLESARANAGVMAEQARRAFEDFVAAETAQRPVLLVIEDLHWGDAPSVSLIDGTLRKLHDRPLMVLALGRPEVHDIFPKLWGDRGLLEIRLGELTRRAAERLVRHALGASVGDDEVAKIIARAGGNAFFLEELIHGVAEGGAGRGGSDGGGDALPETVLAMVQARIDALPAPSRRALRAASVFGETFWKGGVLSLLGGSARTTLSSEWIDELLGREIIVRRRESRFSGEEELYFRHALLRDGAYAMLTEADRAVGHRLAAEWLERAGEVDSIVLAEHFERGGERGRAGAHGMRAALRALGANDLKAAIARATKSLALVEEDAQRFRLRSIIGEAQWYSGDFAASERSADELLGISPSGSEPWCSALSAKLVSGIQLGRAESVEAGMRAVEGIEPTAENARPMCRILGLVAGVLVGVGKYELASVYHERADRAGELVDARDAPGIGVWQLGRSNQLLIFGADPWAALCAGERAVASYEAAGDLRFEMYSRVAAAAACRQLGLFDRAEELLRRVMTFEDSSGHIALVGRAGLVCVLVDRGAIEAAIAEAGQVIEAARACRDKLREGVVRAALAAALRRRGDIEAAAVEAQAAEGLLSRRPFMQMDALAILAAVRFDQGRSEEAVALAERVLLPGQASAPHPPGEALALLAYVEGLTALGRREEADRALEATRARLLEVAARIPDPAVRRAMLEDVQPNAQILALGLCSPSAP